LGCPNLSSIEMTEADVFISYTHRDNWKLTDDQHGWIDRFHEALSARLNSLCGRDTHVWRDPKIGGADLLTPTIAAAVENAAILISVLSPSYFNSEWCAKELQLFLAAAAKSGGVRVGTKSRVVKVLKTPIDRATALAGKPELAESIGYEFFRVNPQGVPHEFDPRLGTQPYQDFLNKVNELAYGLSRVLESFGAPVGRADVVPPSNTTIYLAATSFDVAPQAERLRRELEQFGHTVLPEQPIALLPDYADRVREQLARCDISVHPVGAVHGAIPEGAERSAVELQYMLAGEEAARRAGFVRLPWMPPGVDPTDARQRAFIATLAEDPHLFVTSLENLKAAVEDLLKPAPVPAISPTVSTDATNLYFIHDPSDADAASEVEDALFDLGFNVTHPLTAGDERELRDDHEQNLSLCDAVLIYFGTPNEFWLRAKLRDLQKAFGYGRNRPFAARAVLMADPTRSDKERFRSRDVLTLNGHGTFAASMLDPFLKQMQQSRTEAG
jgi:hypothetical protein